MCPDAYTAVEGADAVVICTEWDEFRQIDWKLVFDRMHKPAFVFDGRLILDAAALREIGFRVHTIGKSA
jgi:UDPglucose 6-dehydrogenase